LNTMLKFTAFHPLKNQLFKGGIELADDLKSDTGTILYPKGTELAWERVNRLLKFRESNPSLQFDFLLKRSDKLIDRLRQEIKEKMQELFSARQKAAVFKKLMRGMVHIFDLLLNRLLERPDMVLELYRMRFTCEFAESQKVTDFADHAMNVAILNLAIATSPQFEAIVKNDEQQLIKYLIAGLFHNYGAVLDNSKFFLSQPEERAKTYWGLNAKAAKELAPLDLGEEVTAAISELCGYQKGERDFVRKEKWAALPNVLVVSDTFLQKEGGLFAEPHGTRDIVDWMNVKVVEKQLHETPVKALTLGLELTDIFDFYAELDRLIKKCPYDAAVAYPLTGLYSPTIFVCKKNVTKCPFLEVNVRAVNLMQRLGDLPSGEYRRCKLLTPKLSQFYDQHYTEIKDTVGGKTNEDEAEAVTPVKKDPSKDLPLPKDKEVAPPQAADKESK
ncbi:MAG: hypothetical protein V1794_07315, partial [Candidatus Glassbacteria bacterium]